MYTNSCYIKNYLYYSPPFVEHGFISKYTKLSKIISSLSFLLYIKVISGGFYNPRPLAHHYMNVHLINLGMRKNLWHKYLVKY